MYGSPISGAVQTMQNSPAPAGGMNVPQGPALFRPPVGMQLSGSTPRPGSFPGTKPMTPGMPGGGVAPQRGNIMAGMLRGPTGQAIK